MPRPRHRIGSRQAAEALVRTAPLVSRWIDRLLAAHDPPLTVAQYLALQAIAEGEVLGAELARRAAVSPAAVSQLLAALEEDGLLTRGRLEDDRRRQPLALTEQGQWALRSAQTALRRSPRRPATARSRRPRPPTRTAPSITQRHTAATSTPPSASA